MDWTMKTKKNYTGPVAKMAEKNCAKGAMEKNEQMLSTIQVKFSNMLKKIIAQVIACPSPCNLIPMVSHLTTPWGKRSRVSQNLGDNN